MESERVIGKHFVSGQNISVFSYEYLNYELHKRFNAVVIQMDEKPVITPKLFRKVVAELYPEILTNNQRAYLALDEEVRWEIYAKDARYQKRQQMQMRIFKYLLGCNISPYRRLDYDFEKAVICIYIMECVDDNDSFTYLITNNLDHWLINDIVYTKISFEAHTSLLNARETGEKVPVKYLNEVYEELESERNLAVKNIYSHRK